MHVGEYNIHTSSCKCMIHWISIGIPSSAIVTMNQRSGSPNVASWHLVDLREGTSEAIAWAKLRAQ